jgi:hypothetical protein
MSGALRCALTVLAALGAGCANVPPTNPPADAGLPTISASATAPGTAPIPVGNRFERRWQDRAREQQRSGCPADAAVSLEVLALLRPGDAAVRAELETLRQQMASRTAELVKRGMQAQARGLLDAAEQQFLAALAVQPDHAVAADALRAVERERNRRNLYKPPRRAPSKPGEEFAPGGCIAAVTTCPAGCALSP